MTSTDGEFNDDFYGDNNAVHESIEMRSEDKEKTSKQEDAPLYGVEDTPSIGLGVLNAIQHLLLSINGVIGIPLMLFSILCFDDSPDVNYAKSKIIGSFFFLAGVISFLQTTFGVRLPTAQIVTSSFFVPLTTLMKSERWKCPSRITNFTDLNVTFASNTSNLYLENDDSYIDSNEVWQRRMREVQGGIIVVGIGQMLIGTSGVLGFVLRFVGPLTIAPPLVIAGIVLLNLATKFSSMHWGVSMCVIGFIVLFQHLAKVQVPFPDCSFKKRTCSTTRKPLFAMFPFIFALLIGWLLAYILTSTNMLPTDKKFASFQARTDRLAGVVADSPWFSFPYPFQWGLPTFSASTIVVMLAAMIVGIADSLCDYYACAKVVGHPSIPKHAINRGISVEGFGVLLHGMLGTGNATTTFASNVIGLGVSRVHSRRVIQYMSGIYVFLGLFTKFCSVFVIIPMPVIGGQIFVVSGYIFSIAVATASYADLSTMRNMFVLGVSTFGGLMFQNWVAANPNAVDVGSPRGNDVIRAILGTGMLLAPIIACILDNTMPGTVESRGMIRWQKGEMGVAEARKDDAVFNLPFKTDWAWTRWVPICPMFRKKRRKNIDNA